MISSLESYRLVKLKYNLLFKILAPPMKIYEINLYAILKKMYTCIQLNHAK
jgi:hypothetical protein